MSHLPSYTRTETPLRRPQTAVTVRVKLADVVEYLRQRAVVEGEQPWPRSLEAMAFTPHTPGSYEANQKLSVHSTELVFRWEE